VAVALRLPYVGGVWKWIGIPIYIMMHLKSLSFNACVYAWELIGGKNSDIKKGCAGLVVE
jgi:hypothetical protein